MKAFFTFVLGLLCLVKVSQTSITNEFMVIDLDSVDYAEFTSQAAIWTLSKAMNPTNVYSYLTPSKCFSGTYPVLGGPNILGEDGKKAKSEYYQKEYPPMETFPTLAFLLIDISLFANTAEFSSSFTSILDITINGKQMSGGSSSPLTCLNTGDVTIAKLLKFPNSKFKYDLSSISQSEKGKGITLRITNLWDYTTAERSIAFSNIRLYLFRDASKFNEVTNFPCGYNFYWDNNRGCVACHPSCKVCTGNTNYECTTCNTGYFKYPNTTCLATCLAPFKSSSSNCNKICTTKTTPYYLDFSATCSPNCNAPLIIKSDDLCSLPCGVDKYLNIDDGICTLDCILPLQKDSTFGGLIKTCVKCPNFLYSDGSCKTECPAPLLNKIIDNVKSCYNPCAKINNYLYPDSSCVANCFLTIVNGIDGQYCQSHCPKDYIYPDGFSCASGCESPLQAVNVAGILFCTNPSCNNGYIYPDRSCRAACDVPIWKEIKREGISYCENSCSGFIYPDGSCLDECESPMVIKQVDGNQHCTCTDYLYPDGSCLGGCEFPLSIETNNDVKYCKTSCPSQYFLYPDDSCDSQCQLPLKIDLIADIQYCKSACLNDDDYLYPDNFCSPNCKSPLLDEMKKNIKYCSFPCQETEYLYWNKTCGSYCLSPFWKEENSKGKFCNFPCTDEDFLYWNETCHANCPFESETDEFNKNTCKFPCNENEYLEVSTDKCVSQCSHTYEKMAQFNKYLCLYPCSEGQYLNLKGECTEECPLPFREFIGDYFKKYCMPAGPVGGGEHPTVPGEVEISVNLNNQMTKLSYFDKVLNADNEAWTLSSRDYTLNPTWTFFGLNSLGEYALDHWDATSSCGCFLQVCGEDCQSGVECQNNDNLNVPWICHPWAEKNNYCWSIISSGKKWYTSYSLKHISTIALTSYGGLDTKFVQPGFTITNQVANHNYAVNGLIIKYNPRNQVNLENSYRYAESEGRVVTIQEFEALNNIPTIHADMEKATCNSSVVNLPLTLHSKLDGWKLMPFHSYIILRNAGVAKKLTMLSGIEILAPGGIIELNNQAEFDFIDPCNQQFLTLQKDENGNFIVKLPASQKLTNADSIICIAVQDNPNSPYDLVLYELKIGTSTWSSSSRFTGILSQDYVQDLTVRLTIQANPAVPLPDTNVDVQFHTEIEPVLIIVRSSQPTTCQLYLSPSCTYDILTESNLLYATKSLGKDCGNLYEKATYNCQGMIGYFFPPNILVKTPISDFVGSRNIHRNNTEIFNIPRPRINDGIHRVYIWLTHWTWQNCLTKLIILSLPILVITVLLFLSIKFCQKRQGKGKKQVKPKARSEGYSKVLGKEADDIPV